MQVQIKSPNRKRVISAISIKIYISISAAFFQCWKKRKNRLSAVFLKKRNHFRKIMSREWIKNSFPACKTEKTVHITITIYGEMAEWPKAAVSKTVIPLSGVMHTTFRRFSWECPEKFFFYICMIFKTLLNNKDPKRYSTPVQGCQKLLRSAKWLQFS